MHVSTAIELERRGDGGGRSLSSRPRCTFTAVAYRGRGGGVRLSLAVRRTIHSSRARHRVAGGGGEGGGVRLSLAVRRTIHSSRARHLPLCRYCCIRIRIQEDTNTAVFQHNVVCRGTVVIEDPKVWFGPQQTISGGGEADSAVRDRSLIASDVAIFGGGIRTWGDARPFNAVVVPAQKPRYGDTVRALSTCAWQLQNGCTRPPRLWKKGKKRE